MWGELSNYAISNNSNSECRSEQYMVRLTQLIPTSTPAVGFALPNTDLISFTGELSE
jgi:hypothetical protein